MLLQTERALSTPLPRIYEYDPDQQKAAPTSEPIPAVAQSLTRVSGNSALSGAQSQDQGVRVSQLNPIALTLTRRLENEVIHPMDQWLKLHHVIPAAVLASVMFCSWYEGSCLSRYLQVAYED